MTRDKRPNMETPRLEDALPVLLLRARMAVAACFKPALRAHDLTEPQFRVLRCLYAPAPRDVSDLSRRTDLLAPSVSRILRDLERRGLVKRAAALDDARRSETELTPAGVQLLQQVQAAVEPIHAQIEARIGLERAAELRTILWEVIDVVTGAGEPERPDP